MLSNWLARLAVTQFPLDMQVRVLSLPPREKCPIFLGHFSLYGQTDTFSGKKNIDPNKQHTLKRNRANVAKLKNKIKLHTCFCGNSKSREAKECLSCSQSKIKAQVANRYPELNELISMVQSSTYVAVSSQLGISDNALKKHLKKRLPEYHPVLNLKPRVNK